MYQAIFFDYQTRTVHLRDSNEGWAHFSYQPTYYKLHPNGEFPTLDGKRCNPTTKYNKEDPELYEKDVDINLRVLLDIYKEFDEPPAWHNKVFLDIETEMGGAINLFYCQNAPVKVTAIALYDGNAKQYYAYILDEADTIPSSNKEFTTVIPCKTEKILLQSFLSKWIEIDPTIVVHFNGDSFDIPYLYNRMRRVLGEQKANSLSPIGIVQLDNYDMEMPYKIAGVNSMDMMRLYKKFIPKQQPSYSLDNICLRELGYGKIKYTGSLDHLFRTDIQAYIDYNINDVKLIVDLEEKLKFIELAITVSHLGHVPYSYVFQSTRLLEGVIMSFCKRKGIISPNKPTTDNPLLKTPFGDEETSFAGAYVMEPKPGLYGWVADLDLTSLYPSNSLLLNCSPETFLFKIVTDDPFDDTWNLKDMKMKDQNVKVQVEKSDGRIQYLKLSKLVKFIEENNATISPNGVAFDSSSPGILSEVMLDWFYKRKYYKDLMKEVGKKGDMKQYAFYNLLQGIYKILLNSQYGIMGVKSCRYSDGKDMIASAITSVGRLVITESATFVDDMINIDCGFTGDDAKTHIVISDTDSIIFSCEALLKVNNINPKDDEAVLPFIRAKSKEYADRLNVFYKTFSKERFNSDNNRLEMKSEMITKKLYISAAKQYAQYIVEKEGVRVEELDFKGVDFIKANFPKIFRDFTQDLMKQILFDAPKSKIDEDILKFREKFKTLPLEDISKPTGINKLKEYLKSKPKPGSIFSTFLPKAPVNTKAATYYNDLLRFKELDKNHPIIQIGDKIRWCYLHKNPYNIEVLAYSEINPPEEILEFMRKYMDREAIFDRNLVLKLQKIYSNIGWGTINFNSNANRFLKFLT